jgi:hypothetical protein
MKRMTTFRLGMLAGTVVVLGGYIIVTWLWQ